MKRFKTVTVLCLAFMLFIHTGAVIAEGETESFENKYELLVSLGIVKDNIVNPEDNISRREFAVIASNLMGSNYSDKSALKKYADLKSGDEAASALSNVISMGIIDGVTAAAFEPDRNISYIDAVKALVRITGYAPGCTDNMSYLACAGSIGILKGVSKSESSAVNIREAYTLVYNSLDIKLLEPTEFSDSITYAKSKTDTILSKNLDIYKAEGVVTANRYCSIDGGASAGTDRIKIDSEIYRSRSGADELLGCRIKYYYKDVDDVKTVLHTEEMYTEDSLVLDADDIVKYENGTYTYEAGEKTKTKSVPNGVYMIYNGRAAGKYGESVYVPEYGSVTLTDFDGDGTIDVLNIKNYTVCVVTSIDKDKNKIYGKWGKSLTITDDSVIASPDGKDMEITDVGAKSVVSALVDLNGEVTGAIVSTTVVIGEISEITGEGEAVIGGVKYDLDEDVSKTGLDIKSGFAGTFYLDTKGRICNAESGKKKEYVYIMKAKLKTEMDDELELKLLDTESKVKTYKNIKNMKVNGVNCKKAGDIIKALGGEDKAAQLVMCEFGENGEILSFETAYNKPVTADYLDKNLEAQYPDDRMRVTFSNYIEGETTTESWYKSYTGSFGGKANLSGETYWFKIPKNPDEAQDSDYQVLKNAAYRFYGDHKYSIESYVSRKDKMLTDVVITYEKTAANEEFTEDSPVSVVNAVKYGLDKDRNEVQKLVILDWGREKEYTLSGIDPKNAPKSSGGTTEIVKGSVVRYLTNSIDEITRVEVLCEPDGNGNPRMCGKDNGNHGANFRITLGGAYLKDNEYIAYRPGNITGELARTDYEITSLSRAQVYIHESGSNRLKLVDINSIATYKDAGDDYSRLFMYAYYGAPHVIVIYR